MTRLRYLLKNLNLLNLTLALVLAYLVKSFVYPFFVQGPAYTPPPVKKQAETAAVAPGGKAPETRPAEAKGPSPADFVVIADQNPFHPERKIPVPKVEAPPLPKPEFVLYGTLETPDLSIAYMEDKKAPKTTQGRGKRIITLKAGDSLSGFVLKQIQTDRVVMTRGEETVVVHLSDRGKVREGSATPPAGAAAHPPGQRTPAASQPVVSQPQPQPAPPQEQHMEGQTQPVPATPFSRPVRRGAFGASRQ